MKSNKIFTILVLTLIIGASSVFLFNAQEEKVEDQESGLVFLSGLSGKINDVNRVLINDGTLIVNLVKNEKDWVVEEKSGYTADFSKVKQLLVTLADMETVESKTSRPENYGRLGVQGVGEPGEEKSKLIQLLDNSGGVLYSVVIGKAKQASGPGAKSALYVRQENEKMSWLVVGEIRLPTSVNDWLDKAVVNIDRADIQSVAINHTDNTSLKISKAEKETPDFSIEEQPSKTKVKSVATVNNIAGSLQNLTFDDVLVRGKFDVTEKEISKAEFKTYDGLLISAKLAKKDDKSYIWFDAKSLVEDASVAEKAQKLNNNFALWVYQIPSFKADSVLKNMDDLVEKEAKK